MLNILSVFASRGWYLLNSHISGLLKKKKNIYKFITFFTGESFTLTILFKVFGSIFTHNSSILN